MVNKQLKDAIVTSVDSIGEDLAILSKRIHSCPELGFQEQQASTWLSAFLEEHGFSIETGIAGLPTAFQARYGEGKPEFGILAEYDALPELGHACGHNIIATSAVGAAVAAKSAVDAFGGTVTVIGTPAEELYGGKIVMAEKGAFRHLDFAMMIHPGSVDAATTEALACQTLAIEYFGKPAHAAARPEEGVNALDALLISYNAINALRQHIRESARIHGIITSGGEAPNIVPAYSAGSFIVRAAEGAYLEELKEKVIHCFTAGAEATGAELKYKWDDVCYLPMKNNLCIAQLFTENMRTIGRDTMIADPDKAFGSTDMGNVSQVVPSIHAIVSIAEKDILVHSPEFAAAAISERGIHGMKDAAKAMALTVADILSDSGIQEQIRKEFYNS